jgi:uncharacterized membrane protein
MKMALKILAVFCLVFFCISTIQAVAADDEEEVEPLTPIANGVSFAAAFLAIGCGILAILEMSVLPQTVWMVYVLAFIMILISYLAGGFRSPNVWITTFSGLIVVIMAVSMIFSRSMAKKLAWG